MCLVAEDLLEKSDTNEKQGWVVLVGDGKNLSAPHEHKAAIWNSLRSIDSFSRGWHILKNYQPILMKVYYIVGITSCTCLNC